MPFPQARAQGSGSVCMPWIVQGVWGPWMHSLSLLFCLMWFGNCHAFFLWFPQLFAKGNICWACAPVREPVRAYDCVFSVERGLRCLHLFSSYPGGWEEWSSHNNNCHGERPCCLPWISASGDCSCTHSFSWHAAIQALQREMSTLSSSLKECSRKELMVPGCVLPRYDSVVPALGKGCGWQVQSEGMPTCC